MSEILKQKAETLASIRIELDAQKVVVDTLSKEYEKLSHEFIELLEALEINSIKMAGFNFYTENKSSVKTPKTPEDKEALFEFLKKNDMFNEIVSVNSQTLNSLYKTLAEEALNKGILEFTLPGVEQPSYYKNLKMKKV